MVRQVNEARELAALVLQEKKRGGLYRDFVTLSHWGADGVGYPYFRGPGGDRLLHMCLNDYLGLSQSPNSIEAARESITRHGVGTCASRNIGGTRPEHAFLEEEIRSLHGQEDCLLNAACTDVIAGILRLSDRVKMFSDEENHASLIEGMRLARAGTRKIIFRHNDVSHLRKLYSRHVRARDIPVLVMETLYSMSGDYAPLTDIVPWFKEQGGLVVLNEVHAVGVDGDDGGGRAAAANLSGMIDIVIGSLWKAIGVVGGYVTGCKEMIDYLRQTGVRAIFTTSLPHYVCAAALRNIRDRRDSNDSVIEMRKKVALLKQYLLNEGVIYGGDLNSHIIPIIIGCEDKCATVAGALRLHGYYVSAIRYPTVPIGQARLRVTVNPFHRGEDIESFANIMGMTLRRCR